jgi:hypothetical protein
MTRWSAGSEKAISPTKSMMDLIGPICELVALASVHLRGAPIKGCLDFSMAVIHEFLESKQSDRGVLLTMDVCLCVIGNHDAVV